MQRGATFQLNNRSYRLEERLSDGSFGEIWAARDADGQPVAVKLINASAMSRHDPSLWEHWQRHFQREIDFLGQLDAVQSRHIVRLLDHGQMEGQPALVLERLQGNLDDWLRQRNEKPAGNHPVALPHILDWALQILAGLEVVHGGGFIYRDLKYSNILVADDGRTLKLSDFGTVKSQQHDSTRSFAGTLNFMAPEQALPARRSNDDFHYDIDYRADYYALGLILFGLLTGQRITASQAAIQDLIDTHGREGAYKQSGKLGGLDEAETEKLRQAANELAAQVCTTTNDATLLPGLNFITPAEQVGRSVFDLVRRLLARDRNERPATATEIRKILQAALDRIAKSPSHTPPVSHERKDSEWVKSPPYQGGNLQGVKRTSPPYRGGNLAGGKTWNRSTWLWLAGGVGTIAVALTVFWPTAVDKLPEERHTAPTPSTELPLIDVVGTPNADTVTTVTTVTEPAAGNPDDEPTAVKDSPTTNGEPSPPVVAETDITASPPADTPDSIAEPAIVESSPPQPTAPPAAVSAAPETIAEPATIAAVAETPEPTPSSPPARPETTIDALDTLQDALGDRRQGPEMAILPAGELTLPIPNENTAHRVAISAIAMAPRPITHADYALFARETHRSRPYDGGLSAQERAVHPVTHITWYEARDYAQWLSQKTGQQYRLPSEAEWLYGEQIIKDGMSGKVQEWLADCAYPSSVTAPISQAPLAAHNGGDCSRRAVRGGDNGNTESQSKNRRSLARDRGGKQVGFRVVRELAETNR